MTEPAPLAIADFKKTDLRVAKILDVQEIAGADKLWKLVVDAGTGPKEIVAGIKSHYAREALLGRSIILVNNLAPAVIRGTVSNGMLLAARSGDAVALLTCDKELPPGSTVS